MTAKTATKTKLLEPIHPGKILRKDFLKPFGISINQLFEIWTCRQTVSA